MKNTFSIMFIFISIILNANNLTGKWILNKIVYDNGDNLEVNHQLYSIFTCYEFNENYLKINGVKFNAKYSNNLIKLENRILEFSFENNFLLVKEKGDNLIYIFSKKNDFLNNNNEFLSNYIVNANDTIYRANEVLKPEFNYDIDFDEFIRKNIPSYSSVVGDNFLFKAEFVFTKNNEIKDVTIIKGISNTFNTEFVNALMNAKKYMKNDVDKDLIITHSFNFFKMYNGLVGKQEKQFYLIQEKAKNYFENNQFEKAVLEYKKIEELDSTSLKERLLFLYNESYLKLGISYLALNQREKACECFNKIGGKELFYVRNYLIDFCN